MQLLTLRWWVQTPQWAYSLLKKIFFVVCEIHSENLRTTLKFYDNLLWFLVCTLTTNLYVSDGEKVDSLFGIYRLQEESYSLYVLYLVHEIQLHFWLFSVK